jgi:hypothetical protein
MTDENAGQRKKNYEPPKITVISLRPEEAVLGHCKSTTIGGPGLGICATLSCNTIGS